MGLSLNSFIMRYFSALILLASLLCLSCAQQPGETGAGDVSVQLYNFRSIIGSDEGYAANHEEVLTALAGMGYTSVEAAGYRNGLFYGVTPEQFKSDVEAAGLMVYSSHTSKGLTPEELESGDFSSSLAWWDPTIAAHKAAGMEYIVFPYMPLPKTLGDLQTYCDYLNAIGAKCNAQGLRFGYHNHAHEFNKVEDTVVYDYMIRHTDPALVFFQMDVYWTIIGKAAPVEYIAKYPGRFELLHIKDNFEIGQSGMVGFDAIFRNFDLAGTKGIVVEEEQFSTDNWKACMQTNIDYIQWLRKTLNSTKAIK